VTVTRLIALPLLLVACVTDPPVTEDDVITDLAIEPGPSGERVADGTTALPIELCVVHQAGRDPTLSAVLRASAGRWVATDAADGLSITVPLTQPCEQRMLVPPTDVGPLTVMATVGGFSKTATESLVAARIDRVRLGATGLLSATDASMLTVAATLDVLPAGVVAAPSKGTDVALRADIEPIGAVGHLADSTLTITTGNTVTTTFFASSAVTRVTFTATAEAAGRAPRSSDPLQIDR
jgi:hypothetical protein